MVARERMRWILWSLKGSDNLAWGEAPGDWAPAFVVDLAPWGLWRADPRASLRCALG